MRASVERDDPAYHSAAYHCAVFLAGAQRKYVVTADEERRYAKLYRVDGRGRLVIKDGLPQFEEFYGDVRIEAPEHIMQLIAEATGEAGKLGMCAGTEPTGR